MSLKTLRVEGPPESGKTTEAFRQLHNFGLRVPADPELGQEDVCLVEMNALLGGAAGAELSLNSYTDLDDAKDSIARAMIEMTQGMGAKACVVARTRDVFAIAPQDAKAILDYIRFAANGENLQYLIFEDCEPSRNEETAREVFDSLTWLRDSDSIRMPQATPMTAAPAIMQIGWDVSRQIAYPFSLSLYTCEAGGWRLGPVCQIAETAAKVRLAQVQANANAGVSVTKQDVDTALREVLSVRHSAHLAILRGKLARMQHSQPMAATIASFPDGVLPTSEIAKTKLADRLRDQGELTPPSNGGVWKTVQALIQDGVLWVGADGKAMMCDALLGVRLQRPEVHSEIERSVRDDRTMRAAKAATKNRTP